MPALSRQRPTAAGWWAAGLGIALALLAVLVDRGVLRALDHHLLAVAQRPSGAALDWLMWGLSSLGRLEVTGFGVLAYVLLVGGGEPARRRLAPLALFAAVTAVELAGKYIVYQPAPDISLHRGPLFGGLGVDTRFAFPSGHMTRLTLLVGLLATTTGVVSRFPARVRLVAAVALTMLVGYSRVYLGEHWPADVAGGVLLGAAGLAVAMGVSRPATSADADAVPR